MVEKNAAPIRDRRPVGRVREGFALAAALFAVVLIAGLVAVVFFGTIEETRMGSALAERRGALDAAESAIELTVSDFAPSFGKPVGIGGTESRRVDGLSVPVIVYITRLDSSLYWLVAEARGVSPGSGVGRRIGVVVRSAADTNHSIAIDRISERGWSDLF